MSIDWNVVGADAVEAMKDVFADKWGVVSSLAVLHARQIVELGKYLEENKDNLDPEVYEHLVQEKAQFIKANLGGLAGISSVVARQAANAALNVLIKALSTAAGLPALVL